MSLFREFKEFAIKGNAIDLAVGVIIGAAFSKMVSSIVEDLLMPLIGAIPLLQVDFSNLYVPLTDKVRNALEQAGTKGLPLTEAKAAGPLFAYGNFFSVSLNFLIVSGVIFLLIKFVNYLKHREVLHASTPPSAEVKLLTEIRDLLSRDKRPHE